MAFGQTLGNAPCKNCQERHLGCHSHCEKYLKEKKLNDERRAKERIEAQARNDYWQTTIVGKRKRGSY